MNSEDDRMSTTDHETGKVPWTELWKVVSDEQQEDAIDRGGRRRSSRTIASKYFDDLFEDQQCRPSYTLLISDNHSTHSSGWDVAVCMPCLDDYHPMDDYMTKLLRNQSRRPTDVSIVFDNPSTICCHIDNPNLCFRNESLASLLSEAIGEVTAKLPDDDGQQANDGLADDKKVVSSLAETPKQFEDSFASIDIFKQDIFKQVVSPVKDVSPTSVTEDIMQPPSILRRTIDRQLFVLNN